MPIEDLSEPNLYYKKYLRDSFAEKVSTEWDSLVSRSGIDVAKNRELAAAYKRLAETASENEKETNKKKSIRTFLIILSVIALVASVGMNLTDLTAGARALWILIPLVVIVVSLLILFLKIQPAIRERSALQKGMNDEAEKALSACRLAMAPLERLFDADVTRKIINDTLPVVTVDKNLSVKRLDFINSRYGHFQNDDIMKSTLALATGEIHGNPYVIKRDLVCREGMETYTGTRTVTWTETIRDNQGHHHTITRSETLHAEYTAMKPFYSETCSLTFASEAIPDLHFYREPGHVHAMDEKQYNKFIKKGIKELNKKEAKALKSGDDFTALTNEEFDVAFSALDRDNDTAFRMMFSPLAMKNMLDIMRNSPYGDDFAYQKDGMLNHVWPEHARSWNMDLDVANFCHYDIDVCEQRFKEFNADYFEHYFYTLAPVLAIPMYQQYKAREYIYPDYYPSNYTGFESEVLANRIGENYFAPADSATRSILKTIHVKDNETVDSVQVTAHSYHGDPRVTMVPVLCIGNGRTYDVPVNWTEYTPISQNNSIDMTEIFASESEIAAGILSKNFTDFAAGHGNGCSFADGLFACFHTDSGAPVSEINNIISHS